MPFCSTCGRLAGWLSSDKKLERSGHRGAFTMKFVSRGGLGSDVAADDEDGPHPVDRHVGLRIRMRRKELGISQERLAEALGLTFQQVQKYERAANRVSASKLWEIARALSASVAYFYDGLAGVAEVESAPTPNRNAHAFLLTPEGVELAALFPKLPRARVRRKVVELVRVLVESDDGDAAAEAARLQVVLTA
jgi:transcriptional regulator with XRE-family HTH domain